MRRYLAVAMFCSWLLLPGIALAGDMVSGRLYVDENGDGAWDPLVEPTLASVEISAGGRTVRSGPSGTFLVEASPDAITISDSHVPTGYRLAGIRTRRLSLPGEPHARVEMELRFERTYVEPLAVVRFERGTGRLAAGARQAIQHAVNAVRAGGLVNEIDLVPLVPFSHRDDAAALARARRRAEKVAAEIRAAGIAPARVFVRRPAVGPTGQSAYRVEIRARAGHGFELIREWDERTSVWIPFPRRSNTISARAARALGRAAALAADPSVLTLEVVGFGRPRRPRERADAAFRARMVAESLRVLGVAPGRLVVREEAVAPPRDGLKGGVGVRVLLRRTAPAEVPSTRVARAAVDLGGDAAQKR